MTPSAKAAQQIATETAEKLWKEFWRTSDCSYSMSEQDVKGIVQDAIDDSLRPYRELALQWRKEKAHTYTSENADEYRKYDAALMRCAKELESLISDQEKIK